MHTSRQVQSSTTSKTFINTKTEIRHKRRITVAAASKILANLTYAYKGMGLSMGTMLAGVRETFLGTLHIDAQSNPR